MTWTKTEDYLDYGDLSLHGQKFVNLKLRNCGLSLGADKRSTFTDCEFRDIDISRCTIDSPEFTRCRFENIRADKDGICVYGASFCECEFYGQLKNVVIGLHTASMALLDDRNASRLQEANLRVAASGRFAIDISNANLRNSGFRGAEIVPFVKFRAGQAVILRSKLLFEKLIEIGRSIADDGLAEFFLSTGARMRDECCIATVEEHLLPKLDSINAILHKNDVLVQEECIPR